MAWCRGLESSSSCQAFSRGSLSIYHYAAAFIQDLTVFLLVVICWRASLKGGDRKVADVPVLRFVGELFENRRVLCALA